MLRLLGSSRFRSGHLCRRDVLRAGGLSLLGAPLLHLEERYAPRFDWPRWFHAQGVTAPTPLAGYRSNDYSLIVQGALDGHGLALGWMHIVEALIHAGRLVALAAPLRTDKPFPILQRRDRTLSPAAVALRDWLASIGYRPT